MPAVMEFDVQRAGYAEQFVQNLQGTIPQMGDEVLTGIKDDIASHAPKKSGGLAGSFYTIPMTQIGEGIWDGFIASHKAAQARAHNWGSGIHGPKMATYPIRPQNSKYLRFEKEGEVKYRRLVMHPGVVGTFYIDETLRVWRPALAHRFGDAIRLAAVSRGWMPGLL
jgi:hypothetical protein